MTGALIHALTNSFFLLTAWLIAGGCAIAALCLLADRFRWTGRPRVALPTSDA